MSQIDEVIIVGGGAAGFFAALAYAETRPGAHITLLERSREVLAKVKISGGGRCNVTHACFEPERLVTFYPRGGKALRGPFSRFQPRDTMAWFEAHGVALKTEKDGRVFPQTDSSQTIIDCLSEAARQGQVSVRCQMKITSIDKGPHGAFQLMLDSGESLNAERLILGTGSNPQGWEWAKQLGHTIESPVPSLFTLTIKDPRLEGLAGVSVPLSRLSLPGTKQQQDGAVLVTHWGLSGPAVLKLSAWAARTLHDKGYQADLSINWVNEPKPDEVLNRLRDFRKIQAKRVAVAGGPYDLPKRLWARLVAAAAIGPDTLWLHVSNAHLLALAGELQNGIYRIVGKSPFKEEFVTCGGVSLDEIDFRTMESKRCPGLYFAGEVLDIDGVTGGFNFQSAWTTGWLAGRAAAAAKTKTLS